LAADTSTLNAAAGILSARIFGRTSMAESIRTNHLFALSLKISEMQNLGGTPLGDRRVAVVEGGKVLRAVWHTAKKRGLSFAPSLPSDNTFAGEHRTCPATANLAPADGRQSASVPN